MVPRGGLLHLQSQDSDGNEMGQVSLLERGSQGLAEASGETPQQHC